MSDEKIDGIVRIILAALLAYLIFFGMPGARDAGYNQGICVGAGNDPERCAEIHRDWPWF